ncbi:MAG TPA: hypothetical protein VGB26_05515 [Nitrospiria bacterium]|jgi:TM2 domain-containing membrane protein YozV
MNHALKGVLLSGLVFPGVGQAVLKQYRRGIILMVTVFVGMAIIVVIAIQQALTMVEKIISEGGIIDMNTLSKAATQATLSSGSQIINSLLLFIIICWIFGVIDAYRIGKKKDLDAQSYGDKA